MGRSNFRRRVTNFVVFLVFFGGLVALLVEWRPLENTLGARALVRVLPVGVLNILENNS
jgi:hypothetical protein